MRGVRSLIRRELLTDEYMFKAESQVCNILGSNIRICAKVIAKALSRICGEGLSV